MKYPNLFKRFEPKKGRAWVRELPAEDLRVFVDIGLQAADHGRLGGQARAKTARRDGRGRFARSK